MNIKNIFPFFRTSSTIIISRIRRRSTWNRTPQKATKLHNLISIRNFQAATKHLCKYPNEASIWTWINHNNNNHNQAVECDDDGTRRRGCSGNNENGNFVFRESLFSEGASLDLSGHRWILSSSLRNSNDDAIECLPLHLACALKPPSEFIKKLIEAYPDALQCQERFFGMLPLHIAVQNGASLQVIIELLSSTHNNEADESAASKCDDFGLLPLHLACTEGSSIDVITTLLRANPNAVHKCDHKGKTPMDFLEDSIHPHKHQIRRELCRVSSYWNPVISPSSRLLHHYLDNKNWKECHSQLMISPEQSKIWLRNNNNNDNNDEKPCLPLHIACHQRAPSYLIHTLLKAYPISAQMTGGTLDLLPLHIACQNSCHHVDVIRLLLQYYPNAVEEQDYDFGLLPLHLAITEGCPLDIIEVLVQASPRTVHIADWSDNTPLDYAIASFHPNRNQVIALLSSSSSSPPPPNNNNNNDNKDSKDSEQIPKLLLPEKSSLLIDSELDLQEHHHHRHHHPEEQQEQEEEATSKLPIDSEQYMNLQDHHHHHHPEDEDNDDDDEEETASKLPIAPKQYTNLQDHPEEEEETAIVKLNNNNNKNNKNNNDNDRRALLLLKSRADSVPARLGHHLSPLLHLQQQQQQQQQQQTRATSNDDNDNDGVVISSSSKVHSSGLIKVVKMDMRTSYRKIYTTTSSWISKSTGFLHDVPVL